MSATYIVTTRNDYDGNLTQGTATITFHPEGSFNGSVVYGNGSNYNDAETSPIVGFFKTHPSDTLNVDISKWTIYDADNDDLYWSESYHNGSSEFYYSGKKMPDGSIVGKYKMAGRNATGTFTFQNAGKGPTPVAAKST